MERVHWGERIDRDAWTTTYTNLGGRWNTFDPFDDWEQRDRHRIGRLTAQAFIATSTSDFEMSADEAYWVTLLTRVLQRGSNPPLPTSLDRLAGDHRAWSGDFPAAVSSLFDDSIDWKLDESISLHPQWEEPFWRLILERPGAARWVTPQAPFEALIGDSGGSHHWVDFYAAHPCGDHFVIEIDGSGHDERGESDSQRDRGLDRAKIGVRRIAGSESNDDRIVSEVINRLANSADALSNSADDVLRRLVLGPAAIHRLAYALVEGVRLGFLRSGANWNVRLDDPLGIVENSVGDILELFTSFDTVWSTGVMPAELVMNERLWSRASGVWGSSDLATPPAHFDLEIVLDPDRPPHAALPSSSCPSIVIRHAYLGVAFEWLADHSVERRSIAAVDAGVRRSVEAIARWMFGIEEFREGQLDAVELVLRGRDAMVMLPTGSGKSLVYQLSGMLRPGVTLVIDPLISLIDDQKLRLKQQGFDRAEGIHSERGLSPERVSEILDEIARGEYQFAFVTPERLQMASFRVRLATVADDRLVGLLVVDEAHCVSEWGHDFRTAYLRLGRNLRRFTCGNDDVAPPLLALTGTASPAVERDVIRDLSEGAFVGTSEIEVVRPASFDRPNLTYTIERYGSVSPDEVLAACLQSVIPAALHVEPDALSRCGAVTTKSGIVFVPHVDGKFGLVRIQGVVAAALSSGSVGIYGGRKPKFVDGNWAEAKAETATDFKNNEICTLVATKSFGMGIDKPNIRYTVHVGFPGSIEAFAQEAGRAGRDGKRSICILATHLPNRQVAAELLDLGTPHLERRAKFESVKSRDDLTRQLYFHFNSFPNMEDEQLEAVELLRELLGSWGGSSRESAQIAGDARFGDIAKSLFRLSAIGIVDDYTLEYGAGGTIYTIYRGDVRPEEVERRLIDFARRTDPGRTRHYKDECSQAGSSDEEKLVRYVELVVSIAYSVIEPSRISALRGIYELSAGADDDQAIRHVINAYLGGGMIASTLTRLIDETDEIDVELVLAEFALVRPSGRYEWAGAAARQIEATPDHPVALLASAMGQVWLDDGRPDVFVERFARALTRLADYRVGAAGALRVFAWQIGVLRNHFGGERADWIALAWAAIGDSFLGEPGFEDLEIRSLTDGPDSRTADLIRARRLARDAQLFPEVPSQQRIERSDVR